MNRWMVIAQLRRGRMKGVERERERESLWLNRVLCRGGEGRGGEGWSVVLSGFWWLVGGERVVVGMF